MAKVKVPRKSTSIDMTAMTDVAFLLLTFFMLATKFKPDEPVMVDTPSSISESKIPEKDVMIITLDKSEENVDIATKSGVFFSVDGQEHRISLLRKMGEKYNIQFTPQEELKFSNMGSFGVPIQQLKQLINMKAEEVSKIKQPGIPCDSLNNQLSEWVWNTRIVFNDEGGKQPIIAIKGDQRTNYPVVKQVIKTLQDRDINKFNFITTMEQEEK